MLSFASRRTDRAAAATAALLLQLAFIAAFLHAFSAQIPPRVLQHELTFFLPPLPRVKPVEQPEAAPRRTARPAIITTPLFAPPPPASAPSLSAPSSTDLQNFGQALSGCAPETYANLTPQQKALCARPGEGWAMQEAPDPLNTRSHVKDEAYWQEQWTEKHWAAAACTNVEITYCQMAQLHAEHLRAQNTNALLAAKKAEALKEPERPLPERVGAHPQ